MIVVFLFFSLLACQASAEDPILSPQSGGGGIVIEPPIIVDPPEVVDVVADEDTQNEMRAELEFKLNEVDLQLAEMEYRGVELGGDALRYYRPPPDVMPNPGTRLADEIIAALVSLIGILVGFYQFIRRIRPLFATGDNIIQKLRDMIEGFDTFALKLQSLMDRMDGVRIELNQYRSDKAELEAENKELREIALLGTPASTVKRGASAPRHIPSPSGEYSGEFRDEGRNSFFPKKR